MSNFQDHFSGHAGEYAQFRPSYPQPLFEYLASIAADKKLLWDAGTGNGQAAIPLAAFFDNIIATDPSAEQINKATKHPQIDYRVEPAEKSSLADQSADMITVFQALHWFDFDDFFAEARRVLKPDGILAVITYNMANISSDIDPITDRYYHKIVGPYWPPDRLWVDEKYQTIPFPFREIKTPLMQIVLNWDLDAWLGYMSTWSATRYYMKEQQSNPIELIAAELRNAWGDQKRDIIWPIYMRVGRR